MDSTVNDDDKRFNDWESNRVTQLIYYMVDCQQGIRDVNGQILSVIAVAGTMLTCFCGVSIYDVVSKKGRGQLVTFAKHNNKMIQRLCEIIEELVTVRRIAFWSTSLIFLIAVLYILVLGIGNVLRYHYCQHLSDRLHSLVKGARDDIDRNALVSFEQFSSPITTYNIKHVNNSHNLLNFVAFYMAGGMAATFSVGVILTQYALLDEHRFYDKFVLTLVVLIIVTAITLFIRFSWNSDEVADVAFVTANQNLEVRKRIVEESLYRYARSFQKALIYLIFPRRHVLQKDALIIEGFLAISLMNGDCHPIHLAFVLIVYSFLFCQARYQINDLRGLEEDELAGRTDRLSAQYPINKKYLINVSMVVCFLRIILAIMLTLFQGRVLKKDIFLCGAALFVFTFLYELCRRKKWVWLTFFLVGAGYPIRVYVGAVAEEFKIVRAIPNIDKALLLVLFWIWGILGSLMAWSREIEDLIRNGKMNDGKHPKRHYEIMYPLIKAKVDRDQTMAQSGYSQKHTFLLRQYSVKDPWNICFYVMLLLIELEVCLHRQAIEYFILETVVILLCGLIAFRTTVRGNIGLYGIAFFVGVVDVFAHFYYHRELVPDVFWSVLSLSVTASILFIRMVPETTIRKVLKTSARHRECNMSIM